MHQTFKRKTKRLLILLLKRTLILLLKVRAEKPSKGGEAYRHQRRKQQSRVHRAYRSFGAHQYGR